MELNAHGLNEVGLNEAGDSSGPVPVEQWLDSPFVSDDQLQQWMESPFQILDGVENWNKALFGNETVTNWMDSEWGIRVLGYHTATWGYQVEQYHAASFSMNAGAEAWMDAPLDLDQYQPTEAWHDAPWASPLQNWNEATWAAFSAVEAWHDAPFSELYPVEAWHDAPQDLLAFNPVQRWNRAIFDLRTAEVFNITGAPYLLKDGVQLKISGADFAADEGGYAWTCSLELVDVGDYQEFNRNDPFDLVLFGDHYSFITESKALSRDRPSGVAMTISGVSPAAVLDFPRADPIDKTWDEPTLASAIAAEVCNGYPLDWQLIDWVVPAFRLAVTGASPLSVLQQLATAAGGLIEAQEDGGLVARPEFPVSVPNWDVVAVDQVFSDEQDNLSVKESVAAADRYNRFYLSDSAAGSTTDRIVFEADEADPNKGTLLVYPGRWRENLVVTSTRDGVILVPLGVISREEEETIEIVQGTGQTAHPIDAILSTEWIDRNLGGVSAPAYSSQVTAAGGGFADRYSLLKIRYRTKALVYRTEYAPNGEAQFLVEEV